MHDLQIKGIENNLGYLILEDIRQIKKQLNSVLENSDQDLFKKLIDETFFLMDQTKNNLTYGAKYEKFEKITDNWFKIWHRYKTYPEAIELIRHVDQFTNYSIAYSYLCLGLSLINEGRTGQYRDDLKRIGSGFLLLSEVIDVFFDYFSSDELKQVYHGAKNAIYIFNRNTKEYFEAGVDLSNLVTQLRAYSSLIIFRIEEHDEMWDQQIEDDFMSGKLDHLIAQAEADIAANQVRDLDEVLRNG
jgi:hypothetical protein